MKIPLAFALVSFALVAPARLTAQRPVPQPGRRIRVTHCTAFGDRTDSGLLVALRCGDGGDYAWRRGAPA